MSEELDFLTVQSKCLTYIFDYLLVEDLRIQSLKKQLPNKKLALEIKHDILKIENDIRIIEILIKSFNESKFSNIMIRKLDDDFMNMIYHGRSKLIKVHKEKRKKKK